MVIRDVCPRCQAPKFKKNGPIHNGKQNHHGHDCGRQFVDGFEQYLIAEDKRTLIERLLLDDVAILFRTHGNKDIIQRMRCVR
jgi:transposase-like protein